MLVIRKTFRGVMVLPIALLLAARAVSGAGEPDMKEWIARLEEMVRAQFAGDRKTQDALFDRMELAFETLDGHMLEIGRDFRKQSDLDLGPIYPFDETLAGYDPSAHVTDDLFANKLAFNVLLNFPLTTLDQRL